KVADKGRKRTQPSTSASDCSSPTPPALNKVSHAEMRHNSTCRIGLACLMAFLLCAGVTHC
uniref:Mucin TcMUCII n=1 Tax=Macrostomum lignano TaxID=282301 RepID=A0A1I8GQH5_9PLAT